jgi:lambda repressor-like predicted transcriptional regulator
MPTLTGNAPRRTRPQRHLELIARRVNAGLSREMLGLRAGIGRETIRMAESGFLPTPRVQFAIATALGLSPLDLWPIERQVQR